MNFRDPQDLVLSGANATSLEHYGRALHQLQCYIEDPVALCLQRSNRTAQQVFQGFP